MASNLTDFRRFDVNGEPTSIGIRWKTWLAEFENLIIALAVEDKKRQRALMLYYAGKDVHDIYKSLITTAEANLDFDAAKKSCRIISNQKLIRLTRCFTSGS